MRCVILDDYQDVARSYADWSVLPDVQVEVVTEHVGDEDELVGILGGATVLVVMRERTPLPRSLLERLPDLRLVVTTGSATRPSTWPPPQELGVVVCGTDSSPTPPGELTWALILGLARHVARRTPPSTPAARGSPRSAATWPAPPSAWSASAGSAPGCAAVAPGVRDGGRRLEPAPHRGAGRRPPTRASRPRCPR